MTRSKFISGMVTGLALGAATTMLVYPLDRKSKNMIKKKSGRILRNIGGVIEDAVDMRRW